MEKICQRWGDYFTGDMPKAVRRTSKLVPAEPLAPPRQWELSKASHHPRSSWSFAPRGFEHALRGFNAHPGYHWAIVAQWYPGCALKPLNACSNPGGGERPRGSWSGRP
ncbi:hypothetical protein Scep_018905 [Stephania cephalantha]|uniref:Uncharacterized protein n=1 Tax=Stephania cephalantha TaxID=152367 RepID=A0AAP0NPA9_9MAGN